VIAFTFITSVQVHLLSDFDYTKTSQTNVGYVHQPLTHTRSWGNATSSAFTSSTATNTSPSSPNKCYLSFVTNVHNESVTVTVVNVRPSVSVCHTASVMITVSPSICPRQRVTCHQFATISVLSPVVQVLGQDYSGRFIDACEKLQKGDTVSVQCDNGLKQTRQVALPDGLNVSRVVFKQVWSVNLVYTNTGNSYS